MAAKTKLKFYEEGTVKSIANIRRNHPHMPAARVDTIDQLPALYTVDQAAEYFQVNKFTIYHWKGVWLEAETDRPTRFTAQQLEDCKVRRKANHPLK